MRKVEIFHAAYDSAVFGLDELQGDIDRWFHEHPNVIVERVLQSQSTRNDDDFWLTISIFYNEVSDSGENNS